MTEKLITSSIKLNVPCISNHGFSLSLSLFLIWPSQGWSDRSEFWALAWKDPTTTTINLPQLRLTIATNRLRSEGSLVIVSVITAGFEHETRRPWRWYSCSNQGKPWLLSFGNTNIWLLLYCSSGRGELTTLQISWLRTTNASGWVVGEWTRRERPKKRNKPPTIWPQSPLKSIRNSLWVSEVHTHTHTATTIHRNREKRKKPSRTWRHLLSFPANFSTNFSDGLTLREEMTGLQHFLTSANCTAKTNNRLPPSLHSLFPSVNFFFFFVGGVIWHLHLLAPAWLAFQLFFFPWYLFSDTALWLKMHEVVRALVPTFISFSLFLVVHSLFLLFLLFVLVSPVTC